MTRKAVLAALLVLSLSGCTPSNSIKTNKDTPVKQSNSKQVPKAAASTKHDTIKTTTKGSNISSDNIKENSSAPKNKSSISESKKNELTRNLDSTINQINNAVKSIDKINDINLDSVN